MDKINRINEARKIAEESLKLYGMLGVGIDEARTLAIRDIKDITGIDYGYLLTKRKEEWHEVVKEYCEVYRAFTTDNMVACITNAGGELPDSDIVENYLIEIGYKKIKNKWIEVTK